MGNEVMLNVNHHIRRELTPNFVFQLIFSGQNLTRIPVWKNQNNEWNYNSITYMDLSCNQISNLNGLNNYPNLETLILDCNYIRDVCDIPLYPYLTTLSLNKNKVSVFTFFS